MAEQPDINSEEVKAYKRNHLGLLNLNANDAGAAEENGDKANNADRDHDGYVDGDPDKNALLEEELALSAADRADSTQLAEAPEHDGHYRNCFESMTAPERAALLEKKGALATAERLSGPDSIAARNAKLDLAIEKAEIIKVHGTAEQREHAEKVELGAQREQAVLGKAELAMQGKSLEERRAIEKDALKSLSAADPFKTAPGAANLGQKGTLESLFSVALLRTLPFGGQNAAPAAATAKPPAFVPAA